MSDLYSSESVRVCHNVFVWLTSSEGLSVRLIPHRKVTFMSNLHIDQLRTLSLQFKDSQGHLVSVTPDSAPQWSFTDPSAIQSTVSADGMTVSEVPMIVGGQSDATVSVVIGSVTFSATDQQPVISGAVASVEIIETDSANTGQSGGQTPAMLRRR